jgi:phospholipid/cholesterol/gamma-HCH transport system permease protein
LVARQINRLTNCSSLFVLRPNAAPGNLENFFASLTQIVRLGLNSFLDLFRSILPFRSYFTLTLEQIVLLGIGSLPVVFVAGIATGSIMALQLGYGLNRFGGNLYIPYIVGVAVLRELGPILSSLLLAGRIGSGITAEISSMQASEQVDAIRVLGSSPTAELVFPRVLACVVIFPALSLIGILAAMGISHSEFGIPYRFFLAKTFEHIHLTDVFGGLAKTLVFGLVISLVACWKGLTARGGTRGVGIATTQVVVISSILVLIGDVFMSKFLLEIGWFGGGP